MQFTEEEANDVKQWVVKKLEDISDADSDVLADYVLALIRSDAPDDEIRKTSVENLEDFLRENTASFVNELFNSFGPKQAQAATPQTQLQQPPQNFPQAIPTTQQAANVPTGPRSDPNNRKRTYNEGFQGDQEQGHFNPQDRAFKTPRRGRGGARGDWNGDGRHAQGGQFPPNGPGGFPGMMPGFQQFDPNDPMAAMMAMQQQMGFPQMPGMPPMPGMPAPGQPGSEQMSNQRCPFYDTQGICYMGDACPYQHGEAGAGGHDEYDPRSSIVESGGRGRGDRGRGDRGRGRGRGSFGGRRGGRSDFSSAGPNEDQSITTIVVEQIPDDKFSEEAVREFFSQFGSIAEVTLQPYKKLALVKYESFAEAKQAWSSPKVIFDNRFVKVYWHKPKHDENNNEPHQLRPEAPAFNPEEFERQQEEAQKAYEEKMKKRRETEEAKQALERQRDELLKKQQEEKERLLQRLGGAEPSNGAGSEDQSMEGAADENVSDETRKLRAQLAALEAEAKTLGIDPSAESGRGGYRGRGGFRGRGTYRGRGGYDPSFRGGYRGRGGFPPRGRGGVLRLDNRPRRVAVTGVELNSHKDEALRQHLIGIADYESIEPNPGHSDSVIVAFKERYQAEKFMFSPWNIPSVGEVQLSWLPNLPNTLPAPSTEKNGLDEDQDMAMDSASASEAPVPAPTRSDMDYDVAEDDNWGME